MNGIRRALVLAGLTPAIMIGASLPASAAFSDSVTAAASVSTLTVQAPANLVVDDWCITTTVTTKRTVYTNPGTGASWQTGWSQTTTTASSSSNVDTTTTSTTAGPGPNETTTTTVDKNTRLYVTANWAASPTRGTSGYVVTAHLADGSAFPMAQTTGTTMSGNEDADAVVYSPRLSVTTMTSYGWTAATAPSRVLSC